MSNSFETPRTVARYAPLSIGFSRQEYCSGLSLPSLGDLPNLGVQPTSPALEGRLSLSYQGSPLINYFSYWKSGVRTLVKIDILKNHIESSYCLRYFAQSISNFHSFLLRNLWDHWAQRENHNSMFSRSIYIGFKFLEAEEKFPVNFFSYSLMTICIQLWIR